MLRSARSERLEAWQQVWCGLPPKARRLLRADRDAALRAAPQGEVFFQDSKTSPTQIAPDAGGDVEMVLVVAGEAQHDVAGAGIGVALDPGGGARLRPGEAAL